eukprot:TRINITY_DN70620_c0_g1_i1.p1 TRINITY_DN70620_c0_g1~~TRINITY_DN70620_c0_g1_i1.p1  ORF type:complete len:136 (-),score=15.65 TRINITY_DN70620_c0_g1_i1:190-597(-)
MPKFYCEYCDLYLTHSGLSGRRQHLTGRRHINNKIEYYQLLIKEKGLTPPIYPPPPGMCLPAPSLKTGLAALGLPNHPGTAGLPRLPGFPALPNFPGMGGLGCGGGLLGNRTPGLGGMPGFPRMPGMLGLPGVGG